MTEQNEITPPPATDQPATSELEQELEVQKRLAAEKREEMQWRLMEQMRQSYQAGHKSNEQSISSGRQTTIFGYKMQEGQEPMKSEQTPGQSLARATTFYPDTTPPPPDQIPESQQEQGQQPPRRGNLGTLISVFQEKLEQRKQAVEGFYNSLSPELRFIYPRTCKGNECRGLIYTWAAPLDYRLAEYPDSWRQHYCDCEAGTMLQLREQERDEQESRQWHDEQAAAERREKLTKAGLPATGRFSTLTFHDYALTPNGKERWYKDQLAPWFNQAVTTSALPHKGFILAGDYGIGKTGLVIAMAKDIVVNTSYSVYFTSVATFKDTVSRAWQSSEGDKYYQADTKLFDVMDQADILILDDLGAGHGNIKEFDDKSPMAYLFARINHRYEQGKTLIITTNATGPDQLRTVVGSRNLERLASICNWFSATGHNLRQYDIKNHRLSDTDDNLIFPEDLDPWNR